MEILLSNKSWIITLKPRINYHWKLSLMSLTSQMKNKIS